MRKQEQRLWDTMKRNAPSEFWLERVENVCVPGMSDVKVHHASGTNCWVELKAPQTPKRATTKLMGEAEGLNIAQINWHLKAASMNQRSFILIRGSDQELFLLPGKLAAIANDLSVPQMRGHSLASTWPEVFEVLA